METSDDQYAGRGECDKLSLKSHSSLNQDMTTLTGAVRGTGWFPGYAINVETGERLNIVYGENSWLVGERGGI